MEGGFGPPSAIIGGMSSTLTQLLAAVRLQGKYDSNDVGLTDAHITSFINLALDEISTFHDWPWLYTESTFNTVAGTTDYTPTTGWTKTHWIAEDNTVGRGPLSVINPRDAREMLATTNTGRPSAYTYVGHTLRIVPDPDAVYAMTHAHQTVEPALSSGGDTALIPAEYDNLIIWITLRLVASRRGETSLISQAESEGQRMLRNIRDNVRGSIEVSPIRTRKDLGF